MNLWECENPGCGWTCAGTGGAVGLRAIGWWFIYGGPILCPIHRPDPIPCIETALHDACTLCTAEEEAKRWQGPMQAELGGFPAAVGGIA